MSIIGNSVELLELINSTRRKHGLHTLSHDKMMVACDQAAAYLLSDQQLLPDDADTLGDFLTSLVLVRMLRPEHVGDLVDTLFEASTSLSAEPCREKNLITRRREYRMRKGQEIRLSAEESLCAMLAYFRA